jgi:hypothetical protein
VSDTGRVGRGAFGGVPLQPCAPRICRTAFSAPSFWNNQATLPVSVTWPLCTAA